MERTLVSDNGASDGLGSQTRVANPGAATLVEAFAPYEPTIQWPVAPEPTVTWTFPEPRPAPNPWAVGLGSAGLAVALVIGFCLGRNVPVSAADRAPASKRVEAASPAGPIPFVPQVLPQAPDLSRAYPVPTPAPGAHALSPAPKAATGHTWASVPAATAEFPAPRVFIRPVTRAKPAPAREPLRMSAALLPPPVQLYGTQRRLNTPVVTSRWHP